MEKITDKRLSGERALFALKNTEVSRTLFFDGESPLKECENLRLEDCTFDWKYPLWYGENITVNGGKLTENARAGIWYTKHITMTETLIEAPKTFRRCDGIVLREVTLPNAAETLWHCRNVTVCHVKAKGDYLAMNSENMVLEHLELEGNYPFDGAKNVTVRDSRLLSKDAFWNAENVTVYDSFISGEYLGWNAKNLTFVNCTIESLQGMCYIENLKLVNCRLVNTTLAFEYSTVEADICSGIDSVLNPLGGTIKADYIGELIIERDRVDPQKTVITTKE